MTCSYATPEWYCVRVKQLWLASVPFREGLFFVANAVDGCSP